jgi:hypothetical protein
MLAVRVSVRPDFKLSLLLTHGRSCQDRQVRRFLARGRRAITQSLVKLSLKIHTQHVEPDLELANDSLLPRPSSKGVFFRL